MGKASNGGARMDKADTMMNLLDSTDSDVEWLSLPPIKGKKPRKKKSSMKQAQDDSCSIWGFMKIFLMITLVGAVALLSVMTVYLSAQLNDIKHQIQTLEGRKSINTEDIQKLYLEMEAANKTLEQQSKHLSVVLSNISNINSSISELSHTVVKLSHGLKAAPELKQLPDKLQTVSQSLAALGSDVSTMKDTVDSVLPFEKSTNTKLDELTQQINELKQSSKPDTTSEELSPELANLVQVLPGQLQEINTTLTTQMDVVLKSLSQSEEKFANLDNATKTLTQNLATILTDHSSITADHSSLTGGHSEAEGSSTVGHAPLTVNYSSPAFRNSVTQIVQNMLMTLKTDGTDTTTHGPDQEIDFNATALAQRVTQLEQNYQDMFPDSEDNGSDEEPAVTLDMFDALGNGFAMKFKVMNASMVQLQSDVTHLTTMLVQEANRVSNVSHKVTAIQNYVARLEQLLQISKATEIPPMSSTPASEGGAMSDSGDTGPKSDDGETEHPDKSDVTTKGDSSTTAPQAADGVAGETETSAKKPAVVIETIHNSEDLENNFLRWDKNGSGKVSFGVLPGFLGPNTPDEEDLKPFDENHDEYYTLEEFSKALGIKIESTASPSSSGPSNVTPST